MDAKTLQEWQDELAPWLTQLQSRLNVDAPALPTREAMADLWISFEHDDETTFDPANWTLILEGLELLDLLVRVDADIGWGVVFSIAGHSHTFAVNEEALFARDKVLPRYVFSCLDSFEIRPYFQSVFLALRRMIGEDDQPWEPPSDEFPRVKQLLLDAWKTKHGRDFDRQQEGRIVVVPEMVLASPFLDQPVPFMVQHSLSLARASRTLLPLDQGTQAPTDDDTDSEQLAVRRRRAAFCFENFKFELLENPATNEVLYHLLQFTKRGVPISELVLDQVLMPQLHFSVAGTFFMDVLGAWSSRGKGLKRFEFSCGRFDLATVGAICSALAQSASIEEFAFTNSNSGIDRDGNLPPDQPPRSVWWPWLAYALFSLDTKHEIERVKLNVHGMTMEDADAIRTVLEHPNPLAYVCSLDEPWPKSPVLSTPPTAARLRPRTRVAIGHRIVIAHEENFVDRGTANLTTNAPHQVVRNNPDEGFVEIVFPGSGVGWIDRADVEAIEPRDRRDSHPVRHLELDEIQTEARSAVLELLRLVGQPLESLAFWAREVLPDDFMTAVCALCPKLKSLRVDSGVESMQWILSSQEPRCRLERLELAMPVTNEAILVEFFKVMGDGVHDIAKSLRALRFRQTYGSTIEPSAVATLYDHLFEMVDSNWRLKQCEFTSNKPSEALETLKEKLENINGRRIFVPEKLAFLSVLAAPRQQAHKRNRFRTSENTEGSARYRLPRETTDLILELADIPLWRICAADTMYF